MKTKTPKPIQLKPLVRKTKALIRAQKSRDPERIAKTKLALCKYLNKAEDLSVSQILNLAKTSISELAMAVL